MVKLTVVAENQDGEVPLVAAVSILADVDLPHAFIYQLAIHMPSFQLVLSDLLDAGARYIDADQTQWNKQADVL